MEDFLYKKNYIMNNKNNLYLTNTEPMLQYIDKKVVELMQEQDEEKRAELKTKILDDVYKIIKFDVKNFPNIEPIGGFESENEKKLFINKHITKLSLIYYLGNIYLNYHTNLILNPKLSKRIPVIANMKTTIRFEEIYDRALKEYLDTLYIGKQNMDKLAQEMAKNGQTKPIVITNEHAYGTTFILPTLIERFLIIQLDSKIMHSLFEELSQKIKLEKITLTEEEQKFYDIFSSDEMVKEIPCSQKYGRKFLYDMFLKYKIVTEEDKDTKLIFFKEFIDIENGKNSKITLGNMITSKYINSFFKKEYSKLLNMLFKPEELNVRNNIAHANSENSDYLCLPITAIMMQLLWDILREDIFEK